MEKIKTSSKNSARVFFALWPAQEMQDELHQVARSLAAKCGGQVTRKNTLHMTLLFIGAIERKDLPTLIESVSKIATPSFMLEINRFSCWRHNQIGYAAPLKTPDELDQLVSELASHACAGNLTTEHPKFSPHVTLLRKIGCCIESQDIQAIRWRVASFELVESIPSKLGRDYCVLRSWPLVNAGA